MANEQFETTWASLVDVSSIRPPSASFADNLYHSVDNQNNYHVQTPMNFGELMFERILIATDGSKNGEKAAKVGIELAKLSGGKVLIVYVADIGKYMPSAGLISPFGGVSPDAIDNVVASIREAGEKATLQVDELARASGVTSERLIVEGNPRQRDIEDCRRREDRCDSNGQHRQDWAGKVPHGQRSGKSSSQLKAACPNSSLKS